MTGNGEQRRLWNANGNRRRGAGKRVSDHTDSLPLSGLETLPQQGLDIAWKSGQVRTISIHNQNDHPAR